MRRSKTEQYNKVVEHLHAQDKRSLLRFLTCGSVDDGKSTLIGRLLYDAQLICEDQLSALQRDSRTHSTNEGGLDLALLVDGLDAEREQGITIDVAYRFFTTDRRKFIVADAPGHEEYTRNMATGASTADLAIVLVDSRRGILRQTLRHSYIATLLGIRHIVLAVNKLDLVDYDQATFDRIEEEYNELTKGLANLTIQAIPLSARYGDNVTRKSENTPWYEGPSLLEYLERVEVVQDANQKPFRFPVQYVLRHEPDFRGFAGQIASGSIAVGDEVIVAKSGQRTRIKDIIAPNGPLDRAIEGQSITIVLEDQLDVSRGNLLSTPLERPHVADQFRAHVIWFDSVPLIPGRSYILRTETDCVEASVTTIKYEIDVNTFTHLPAKTLHMNGVAVCNFFTRVPFAFDAYSDNRATGGFVLVDRNTNWTVGAGMIDFPLRRADNVQWQALEVDRKARAALKHQSAAVVWFTGLSGSGKSTIANGLEKLLHANGRHTYMLDGDNVRQGLNKDLGFTDEDRVENIRRVAEVAKLMADAGLIVLVSFISPFRAERQLARDLIAEGEFTEVFVDTPIEECVRRDPKGLYRKAILGALENFTGISSPYEPPSKPELHLKTVGATPADLALRIYDYLEQRIMQAADSL